jgi:hypothetical protein
MEKFGLGIYIYQLNDEADYHKNYPKYNRKPSPFGEEFRNEGNESRKQRGLIDALEHTIYPVI